MQPFFLFAALACWAVAAAIAVWRPLRLASAALSLAGIIALLAYVVVRRAQLGFLPFASRLEAMVLFALAVAVAGFVLHLTARRASVKAGTDGLAALLLAVALFLVRYQPGTPLNPLLAGRYFAVHILLAFAGYGALAAGLVWSVVAFFDRAVALRAGVLHRLSLAVIALLGAGILLGAMWADESWGNYWSWDPKESWALLTWTLMVAYLHLGGPRPRRGVSALFFGLATLAMLFTFVGINLLRWGLHRYQ